MGLADMLTGGKNSGFTGGRDQIINGKTYQQYSPEWYAAMDADKTRKATAEGTALGTGTKAAYDAMGNPADTSKSSSAGAGGSASGSIPRIGESGGGWTEAGPSGSGSFGTPSPVSHISMPDMQAAESASFGRAKDQVGQETQGALTGLRSALAGRGMLGSGAESRGTVSAITKGQGELGEVSRRQAENELSTNLDVQKSNQAADLTGRGQDVSMRGQNMDYASTHRGQDITQRGQDIQQQEANASLQMTKSLQEAAQRQAVLNGIMSAISSKSLY
jgi:hypothetical protein